MNQRLYLDAKMDEEKTFLRKKKTAPINSICLNVNKFFWSIHEENNSDDITIINNNTIHSNPFYDRDEYTQNKQIIPIGDIILKNKIQENIKSILCANFVTDRNGLFNKLLKNKINKHGNDNE